jgi:hypothetical protein
MAKQARSEASQRKLQTSPGLSLIGIAVKFKSKWAAFLGHMQRHHFKCAVYSRDTHLLPTRTAKQVKDSFLHRWRDLSKKLR